MDTRLDGPPCPSHLEVEVEHGVRKLYCTRGVRGHGGLCGGTKERWRYLLELKAWRNRVHEQHTITTRGI